MFLKQFLKLLMVKYTYLLTDTLHVPYRFLSHFFFDFSDFYVGRKKMIEVGNFTTG